MKSHHITVKDIVFIILVIVGCILLFRACKACDGIGGKPTHTDTVKPSVLNTFCSILSTIDFGVGVV